MEKLISKAVIYDPNKDDRSPSEVSLQLDDKLDVEAFHHRPTRKPPLEDEELEESEYSIYKLHTYHETDFVMLMYGFMNDNKIDLNTITETDLDSKVDNVTWFDFKSMSMYSGVQKHQFSRREINEAAERLTGHYEKQDIGPFTVKNPDDTYRVLDPEYIEFSMLYYYGRHNICMLVRVVPWQAMFHHAFPGDMEPMYLPEKCKGRKYDELALETRDCMLASKRMMQDILNGFVNDLATSPFFYSHTMKHQFFKFIKKEGDLNEVFKAVDKFSKPGRPKTFLYCIVANAKPNMNFLDEVLTRFLKSDLSEKEKNLQIIASCAAACRWGHVLIYEKLSRLIKTPTFEMLRKTVVGGNADIMRGIVRDYNWSEKETKAAMEWACFLGYDSMVRVLQDQGIRFSDRCLYDTACGGNMGLFFEICSEGVDLETVFKDGQTVLHIAAEKGHFSIVEFLVHRGGVNVDIENSDRATALDLALRNGHLEVAETLLDGQANVDHQDVRGSTPLHKACASGNMQLVERILSTGCSVDLLDNTGRSVLHKAAYGGNLDVIQRICQLGNKVDLLDKYGSSVVHYASIQGHLDAVEHFVNDSPALIALGNIKRWNPIACAAFGGHFSVLEFLIRNRAGILVVTSEGRNAKQLAEEGLAFRESNEKYYMEEFDEYVSFGSVERFNRVIDALSDVTRQIESDDY